MRNWRATWPKGKGYTTDSIRPLALYLLESAAEPGQSSKVLAQRMPDLSNAPVYPFLVARLMKVLPFKFVAKARWTYQPEIWISLFNQALFLCGGVLFFLARRLFDPLWRGFRPFFLPGRNYSGDSAFPVYQHSGSC